LDTCVFLWLCADPDKLSDRARNLLNDEENARFLSHVSVLEISLKWHAGKVKLPHPPRSWIQDQVQIWRVRQMPITSEEIYRSVEMPKLHRDPFDRVLVATAIEHGLTLITPDGAVQQYDVAWEW
jgi:PIN domain nuclease of toxin-antitoxin system